MYRRPNVFTFHNLKTLSKVCNKPSKSSLFSINKLRCCRSFSTALEIPYYFYSTNESNSENVTNNFQQYQYCYFDGNLDRSEKNVNWVYGQNPCNQFQYNQNHNFNLGYVENGPRNGFLEYPDGRNGRLLAGYVDHNQKIWNFGVYYGSDGDYLYRQNGYEYVRGYADDFQQNGFGIDYRQGGFDQRFSGVYYGGNNGSLQQRWEWDNHGMNHGNCQHYVVSPGNLQQNWNADYSGVTPGNLQQRWYAAGYPGENFGNSQQTWNADNFGGCYWNSEHGWGVRYSDGGNGHPPCNWNHHYTQNVGMHQETSHYYYAWNGGASQFPQSNDNAGNVGIFHGNTGITNNHSNIGEFHQFTGGSRQFDAGFDQQTSEQCERGYVDSLGESSMKPNEESEVFLEELKGTIEELDKFIQECKLKEVVYVLGLLEAQHIFVDLPRYLLLFKACCEEKALEEGKSIHEHLLRSGLPVELKIHNKILEMYCSCGSWDDAFEVFYNMPSRNLTTWDTMISFLAKNDYGEDAIALFSQFKETGLRPDGTMFLGIFTACGAVGDTVEGLLHFESMRKDYSIVPSMEHYVSVVGMLGTAGNLDEALEFIEKMPLEPSTEVWEELMNLCRMHGNLELGDRCAEHVEFLDPSRLDEQSRAGYLPLKSSGSTKDNGKKKSGQSFPDGRSRVHEYRAGDRSQPELNDLLRGMKQQLKEAGYVPEGKSVLHDIDLEAKEEALMAHSERLALAQGLMTTPARYPIRIIKNLRICVDCHNTTKMVSKLVGRELIIRDAKRFHHFKDGLCSCRDYW